MMQRRATQSVHFLDGPLRGVYRTVHEGDRYTVQQMDRKPTKRRAGTATAYTYAIDRKTNTAKLHTVKHDQVP